MSQFARPSSTVSQGTWVAEPVLNALWESIDEVEPNVLDYIGKTAPGACEVGLSSLTDPGSSTGHTVRYRCFSPGGSGQPEQLTVQLKQGTTVIASKVTVLSRSVYVEDSFTLTGPQADSITDYTDLRLNFNFNQGSATEQCRVSWAEFEVPDVVISATGMAATGPVALAGQAGVPVGATAVTQTILEAVGTSVALVDATGATQTTLEAAGTAVALVDATGACDLAALLATGSGALEGGIEINGSGGLTMPSFAADADAQVVVDASGSTVSAVSSVGVGTLLVAADGTLQGAPVRTEADGIVLADGSGTLGLAPLGVTGTGMVTDVASATLEVPAPITVGTGTLTVDASATAAMPAMALDADGVIFLAATAELVMPALRLVGTDVLGSVAGLVVVLNARRGNVSRRDRTHGRRTYLRTP